jgi:hypothetical protein
MGAPRAIVLSLLAGAAACQATRSPVGPPEPAAAGALAADGPATIPPVQYLRQLSLDLRGRPPTAAELDQVVQAGQGGAAVVVRLLDGMLASPDFLAQVRDWHAEVRAATTTSPAAAC